MKGATRRASGIVLSIFMLASGFLAGCGGDQTETSETINSTELLSETTTEGSEPESQSQEEGSEVSEISDPDQPVIFENTWSAVPGDAIGIYGVNFAVNNEPAQVYLAPMSGYDGSGSFELYELNILSQDDGVIMAEIPGDIPADNYIGYVRCADKLSRPFYVNTPELDWVSDVEICAGMSVRVFGRNLLNPKTQTAQGAGLYLCSENGTEVLQAEITAATEYTVDFVIPDNVTEGKQYTVRYNNGAAEYGTVELDEGEDLMLCLSDAQMEELKELYDVEVAWASNLNLTDIFNIKDYGAVGDGTAEDHNALRDALIDAGRNGGGIVYLPEGTYNMTNAVIAFDVPNNVIVAGDGQDKTLVLIDQDVRFTAFYGGITGLTLQSDRTRPEDDTTRHINGYGADLLYAGRYTRFFAKDVGIKVADGCGFYGDAQSQILMEDCSIDCSHWGIWLEDSDGIYRKKILNNYVKNTQRPILTFGSYTWVDGNLFEGDNGGDNCEKGNSGRAATMEHRICDMGGDKLFYGNNTIIGTIGDIREDVPNEDNCGEGILNQQDGRIGIGTVKLAEGTTLTASDMDFDAVLAGTDPVAESKGTRLIGAKIFLITGKGLGQGRTVVQASGDTLILDENWDYAPQEGDLFVLDFAVPERNIIVNNDIQAQTRKGGIMFYGRSCDNIIADNTMNNSGGIWFGQAQVAEKDRFGMSYFNFVEGNQLSGGIKEKPNGDRDNTLTIGPGDDGGCGVAEDPNLPELTAYYGNLYRNNTIQGRGTEFNPRTNYQALFVVHNGIVVSDESDMSIDWNKGAIVANNTVTNSINGVSVSSLANYTLLYKNHFSGNKVDYNDTGSRNTVIISDETDNSSETVNIVNSKDIGITSGINGLKKDPE